MDMTTPSLDDYIKLIKSTLEINYMSSTIFTTSLVLWGVIFYIIRALVGKLLISKNVTLRDQYEVIIRLVSIVHCIPCIFFALNMLLYQDMELYGRYKYACFIGSVSVSYFTLYFDFF